MFKKGDFHLHTTASDGKLTPSELIKMASTESLDIIAITDHDTTKGVQEGILAGDKLGVKVIPGIEFSTIHKEESIHILGYFKDDSYKIVFSANLLNDSSIVYGNSPTDALIEDFKVRNIRLTSIRKLSNMLLNDTLELHYGKIYTNYENKLSIQLDSVTEDSRCPYNVECIWAGNAKVKFDFIINNKLNQFSLNTSTGFLTETIISGFIIQLIELKPYPVYPNPILQKDYIARVKISRQN